MHIHATFLPTPFIKFGGSPIKGEKGVLTPGPTPVHGVGLHHLQTSAIPDNASCHPVSTLPYFIIALDPQSCTNPNIFSM